MELKKSYRITDGKLEWCNFDNIPIGWEEYIPGKVSAEVQALIDSEAEQKTIAYYKSIYLEVVENKLKSLDYDSLATVQIWVGNTTFINGIDGQTYGDEATAILNWYQAIITKNYAILKAIKTQTKYNVLWDSIIPTKAEYLVEINSVPF